MCTVFFLGIPSFVAFQVTAHVISGSVASISGAVAFMLPYVTSVLPVIFSIGSTTSVDK